MRWSAVLAGTILAIGLWILLQMLGMGLGLAAIDTDDAGSLRGVGIGTGIWSLIAPLIAMFVGGLLVGRLAATRDPKVGAMHGAVLWALTTVLGIYAIISIISSLASGVTRVGSAAVGATSSIVSGAVSAGDRIDPSALGIDTNDMLAPINQRLREQGKPAITSDQLNATLRAVAQKGLRQGRLDQELLVTELARNTALSRADAEDIARQISDRYGEVSQRVGDTARDVGETAKRTALTAGDQLGKGMLWGGLALLLGLISAVAGAALGARGNRRDVRDDPRMTTDPVVTTTDPLITRAPEV